MVIYSNQDDDETQKTVSDIKKNQSGKACETTCDVRQTEVSMQIVDQDEEKVKSIRNSYSF